MNLVIVESPTKARTLARFLGPAYTIEASMGHVMDLPKSKLGIDVAHDFAPQYVVSRGKEKIVKDLKASAGKATQIILATDPDREGEAIAWHISQILNSKSEILRITFHEITQSAIKNALANPGQVNMMMVEAQQARRILDRLVGYKLSPLLWRKVRRGLSAGRVQSVTVRLIVEREREILAFKPQEYWEIVASLKKDDPLQGSSLTLSEFAAKLVKIDEKAAEINSEEQANKHVGLLEKARYQVATVETKEVKRYPYPPFTTSTLQQAAANLFGFSAKRTMQIAQNLYEQGLITYHRTDSTNLALDSVSNVRLYIKSEYGERYLPAAPKFYKTKSKVAQEAHEAVRPTSLNNRQLTINSQLDRDQSRLYELIWKRFVACQMTEATYEQTAVDIVASATREYLFRATGSKQLFDGWRRLYQKDETEGGGSKTQDTRYKTPEDEERSLPKLTIGEIVQLLKLLPSQHFTQAAPRYTEASLIKALEEYGIGRPSTYAPIISTIEERQYVEKEDRKLKPTNLGFAVTDFLLSYFPNILNYEFTAGMEDDLDAIANGEKQWLPVIKDFYLPFENHLEKVQETAQRVKIVAETTEEICPSCQSPLVIRIGKFGKFLACSKFPDCKFTKPFQKKIGLVCPKCGTGDVIIRRTRTKRSFYGCSRYPDCDFASWTKPKITNISEPIPV